MSGFDVNNLDSFVTSDRKETSPKEQGVYEIGYDNRHTCHITITSRLDDEETLFHIEPHFEEDELDSDVDIVGEDIDINDDNLEEFARFLIEAGRFLLERHRLRHVRAKRDG